MSPTEHSNEENNYIEDMAEDLYESPQNRILQGHDWSVRYREYYEYALLLFKVILWIKQ